MSAVHSATISVHRPHLSPARPRTYLVATLATAVGALAIAAVMTLSILFAAPASSFSAAPAPEPMPQPIVPYGLER